MTTQPNEFKEFDERFPISSFLNGDESSEFDRDIIDHRNSIKAYISKYHIKRSKVKEVGKKIEKSAYETMGKAGRIYTGYNKALQDFSTALLEEKK